MNLNDEVIDDESMLVDITIRITVDIPPDVEIPKFRPFQEVRWKNRPDSTILLVGMIWVDDEEWCGWYYSWGDGNSASRETLFLPLP